MKHHLVLIKSDPFFICKRLKRINKNFFVFYNKLTQVYQLFSKRGRHFVFEADLGSFLNYNALVLAEKNSVKHLAEIIKNIDEMNEKLEKESSRNLQETSSFALRDMLEFANKKNCDVDFSNEKIFRRENDS